MDNQDDLTGTEGMPGVTEPVEGEGPPRRAGGVRVEKKRRKVSLIAAIVFNVVTLITLAIILLAVLLPGYRRSFTVARATRGSEEVLILVRTSESKMRENKHQIHQRPGWTQERPAGRGGRRGGLGLREGQLPRPRLDRR